LIVIGLAITFADTSILAQLRLIKPEAPAEPVRSRGLFRRHTDHNTEIDGGENVVQHPLLSQAASTSNTERKLHLSELLIEDDLNFWRLLHSTRSPRRFLGLIVLLFLHLSILGIFLGENYNDVVSGWTLDYDDIVISVLVLMSTLIKSLWATIERGKRRIPLILSTKND
jgi:hypothetical protein